MPKRNRPVEILVGPESSKHKNKRIKKMKPQKLPSKDQIVTKDEVNIESVATSTPTVDDATSWDDESSFSTAASPGGDILTSQSSFVEASKFTPSGDAEVDGVFVKGEDWTAEPSIDQLTMMDLSSTVADQFPQDSFMKWVLHPVSLEKFHSDYFETKPLLVSRGVKEYNSHWLTAKRLRTYLNTNKLRWGQHFTVHKLVADKNGVESRKDYGLDRKDQLANGKEVIKLFDEEKCSIRFLNPHFLDPKMKRATELFEGYWNNFAGNNLYYTPPNAAGFAPHWDDVDAWLIQAEGVKEWSLWAPPAGCELPRHYSIDFRLEELGDPDYVMRLEAGDVLYIPRGWIHAGRCDNEDYSLHMTLSSFYRHTWADLLRIFMDKTIRNFESTDIRLRDGLPRDLYRVLGTMRDLDCSPFEHWPIAEETFEEVGEDAYRNIMAKQAREGPHSVPLGDAKTVTTKESVQSANQQRKKTKNEHKEKKSEDPLAKEEADLEKQRPELKRRTRIGAYVRRLICDMMGVITPLKEEDEDLSSYNKLQKLPLDESVDQLATAFYERRLPPKVPSWFTSNSEKGEMGEGVDNHDQEMRASDLCEIDRVRLVHPSVVYAMLKLKPGVNDPPVVKVREVENSEFPEEDTFLLLHHRDNALSTDKVGIPNLSESIELPLRAHCSIKFLQGNWPNYVDVKNIPMLADTGEESGPSKTDFAEADQDDKVMLCTELLSIGVLEIKED